MISLRGIRWLPFSSLYSFLPTLKEGDHVHPSKTKLLPEHFGEKIAATIDEEREKDVSLDGCAQDGRKQEKGL